jgi:hypothetical protein
MSAVFQNSNSESISYSEIQDKCYEEASVVKTSLRKVCSLMGRKLNQMLSNVSLDRVIGCEIQ